MKGAVMPTKIRRAAIGLAVLAFLPFAIAAVPFVWLARLVRGKPIDGGPMTD
jgi:hypothetical protein